MSLLGKYKEFLLMENANLKEENKELMQRANNLSYVMSDLHIKVEELENKKKRLLTAI